MRKLAWTAAEIALVAVAIMLAVLASDDLAAAVAFTMAVIVVLASWFGFFSLNRYLDAFRTATRNIRAVVESNAESPWEAIHEKEIFFGHKELDGLFRDYVDEVQQQRKYGIVLNDIQKVANEDMVFVHSWQGVMQQIPGTLTGLGILGTFLGLVVGIRDIRFDDMNIAIISIQNLLAGISTAFYTSIVGVSLSILFNILNRMLWNVTIRELGLFTEEFYRYIIPSEEEQLRIRQKKEIGEILSRMDRMPSKMDMGNFGGEQGRKPTEQSKETALLLQVQEGLRKGEFTFHLQPIFDLNTRKIVAAEALVRWIHPQTGIVQPGNFMPVIEKNGYITKLDFEVWDQVCKTIRQWIDTGKKVVPITVNVSKTDILALDVVKYFQEMLQKYRIPPMYIEIDIAESAYLDTKTAAVETERGLRQLGMRVSIDDFSGDFITLNTIEDMHPDMLKLNVGKMPAGSSTIDEIFRQAGKLHMNVAALGVENMEMMAILRKNSCVRGQGYYLAKPISIEDFETEINRE